MNCSWPTLNFMLFGMQLIFLIFNCFRHCKSGHDQVTIIVSEVVEDHRDLALVRVYAQLEVACIVGGTSILTSNVTVVSDTIID